MQKILTVAWRTVVLALRDRRALVITLVAPLILIMILGTALKGAFSGGQVSGVAVAVVDEDQGALSKGFVEQVLGSDDARKLFKTTILTDLDAARKEVGQGTYVALIHFPKAYTAGITQPKPGEALPKIEVVTDAGKPDTAQYVVGMVQLYSTASLAQKTNYQFLGPKAASLQGAPSPILNTTNFGTRSVSALAYYASGMGVMFLLIAATAAARNVADSRDDGTLGRMLTSPTSRTAMATGEFLGIFLMLALQFGALVLGSRYLFGVQWGDPVGVLCVVLAYSFALAGIALTLAAFIKSGATLSGMAGTVSVILGALGGSMMPLFLFPPAMQTAARVAPNTWALTAFQDLMAGSTLAQVTTSVWVLLGIGVVLGGLGSLRLSTR